MIRQNTLRDLSKTAYLIQHSQQIIHVEQSESFVLIEL